MNVAAITPGLWIPNDDGALAVHKCGTHHANNGALVVHTYGTRYANNGALALHKCGTHCACRCWQLWKPVV